MNTIYTVRWQKLEIVCGIPRCNFINSQKVLRIHNSAEHFLELLFLISKPVSLEYFLPTSLLFTVPLFREFFPSITKK